MFKLEEIVFGNEKFRKLQNINISIASNITVIAGHNGVGKSTILGLIANCSGEQKEKSLFGQVFRSNFQELFHLDYYKDYQNFQTEHKKITPKVYLKYNYENNFIIEKSCSVSASKHNIPIKNYRNHMVKIEPTVKTNIYHSRNNHKTSSLDDELNIGVIKQNSTQTIDVWRLRIIPRTSNIVKISSNDSDLLEKEIKKINASGSAKIPLPTIYLGMSRMTPIGEFSEEQIERNNPNLEEEDKEFIINCYREIFPNCTYENQIISHSFSGSKKGSCMPIIDDCDSFSVSLGQDSLSSIITALASFNQLKRKQKKNYYGGILIIDEVDAGLHPRAQEKLISVLAKNSKNLNLQIIITTHSLTIIEKILNLNDHKGEKKIHNIVYLMDTKQPRLMIQPTLDKIKKDMLALDWLDSDLDSKPTKIYFEDNEALFFFEHILNFKNMPLGKFDTYKLELISLNLGCDILLKLFEKDDYFKKVIFIPDNDVTSKDSYNKIIENNISICPLPSSKTFNPNTAAYLKTPEMILYKYLEDKLLNFDPSDNFWKGLPESCTTDYIEDRILSMQEFNKKNKREINKKWFDKNKTFILRCNIVEKWCEDNIDQVEDFIEKLRVGINKINNC